MHHMAVGVVRCVPFHITCVFGAWGAVGVCVCVCVCVWGCCSCCLAIRSCLPVFQPGWPVELICMRGDLAWGMSPLPASSCGVCVSVSVYAFHCVCVCACVLV